jgi:hypothetical protein
MTNSQRIKELQELARTARYNQELTYKRLLTAKRRNNQSKIEQEQELLEVWEDFYNVALEDMYN